MDRWLIERARKKNRSEEWGRDGERKKERERNRE